MCKTKDLCCVVLLYFRSNRIVIKIFMKPKVYFSVELEEDYNAFFKHKRI